MKSKVNSLGLTKEDMDTSFTEVVPEQAVRAIIKHVHWVGPSRICKICFEIVKEIE